MRINFRQGIISYPTSGNAQAFLVKSGSYVNLQAGNSPVNISLSHKDVEYLITETTDVNNAWGPLPAATDCWLYWDVNLQTGARTFGYTGVEPVADDTEPAGIEGLHWYDTLNHVHYLYTSGKFREVVRVFAAKINTNTFYPLGVGFPLLPYAGSQVGVYTPNTITGHIIADNAGAPVRRANGTFFTTESDFFVNGSPITPIRIEATVVTGTAQETMAKYQVVKFSDFGKLNLAGYDDTQTTTLAMLMDDLVWQEVGTVCVQGLVTNPAWDWSTAGAALWVLEGGELTDVDPHVANSFVYPNGKPPVGRVVTKTSIIFDQGLGGKGDRGEKGLAGEAGDLATTATYGVARLATAPVVYNEPIVVGDNDPRLTNKVLKAGDTMTGPLVLSGDPLVSSHAANKAYVDQQTSNIYSTANTFTATQTVAPVVLTDGATINVNAALSNNFRVVLGGDRTLANPTNLTNGSLLHFLIKQDGVGGRLLSFGSKYDFGNAGTPTLTTTPNGRDFVSCYYDLTDDMLICSFRKGS